VALCHCRKHPSSEGFSLNLTDRLELGRLRAREELILQGKWALFDWTLELFGNPKEPHSDLIDWFNSCIPGLQPWSCESGGGVGEGPKGGRDPADKAHGLSIFHRLPGRVW